MHKHHDRSTDQTMEEVLFQEVQTVLLDLIEKPPEKRREIFRLHRLDGLSYHEIAQRLCISENTVDTQMRKSLQFIRNEFEKHHG
jgi:RNA polymerase sigma-70 factor (ECF subfamily)